MSIGAGMLLLAASITGCGPSAEMVLRQRYDQFARHLLRGESEACVQFINPAKVRSAGTEGTKLMLGILHNMVKVTKIKEEDIRCDRVEVAADGNSALVYSSFRINGEWKPQQSGKWILVDGQWYVE